MKKLIFTTALVFLLGLSHAQENKAPKSFLLPSVHIKTIDGNSFNTKYIQHDGKPVIICFFATWCKPCMVELKAIADVYDDWIDETGVKIYAVSIDDSRSSAKVSPLLTETHGNMKCCWMKIKILNVH
jgi:thiol-disulfide isomerase/thioredoxin